MPVAEMQRWQRRREKELAERRAGNEAVQEADQQHAHEGKSEYESANRDGCNRSSSDSSSSSRNKDSKVARSNNSSSVAESKSRSMQNEQGNRGHWKQAKEGGRRRERQTDEPPDLGFERGQMGAWSMMRCGGARPRGPGFEMGPKRIQCVP